MRRLATILLAMLPVGCATTRPTAVPASVAEREILDLERAWDEAELRHDGAALDAAPIAGGSPVTLASNEWNIDDIELDDTGVYWTSTNGNTTAWLLRSVLKTGGAPTTIVSEPFGGRSFGIGGGALVWAALTGPTGQDAIRRQLVNAPIQTIALTSDWPDSIVADDTNVYWVDYPEYPPCASDEWLYLAPVGGGNAQAIARVAGDGTIGHGVQFAKLAIDEEAVYWTALADGTVMKTAK